MKPLEQSSEAVLAGALERTESTLIGADAGEVAGVGKLGVEIKNNLEEIDFDVLIEFTLPRRRWPTCRPVRPWVARW